MRKVLVPILLFVAGRVAASGEAPLNLTDLIDEALAANPSLAALRSRTEAAQERVPQAGALMDPMVRFDLSNVPLSDLDFDSTPMSGKQLMVSQRFPWWGKLRARERMAEHAAAAAQATAADREVAVTEMVKRAYHSLVFIDQATAITRENQELLRDFVRIAKSKYEVGRGLQQDVLKAQVSVSGIADRLIVLRRQRRDTEARLNAILDRLPQAPLGATQGAEPTFLEMEVDTLQALALLHHPSLREVEEMRQRWLAAGELADRQRRPDIDFFAAYRQRADMPMDAVRGSDFVSLGVAVNLPIYQGRKQDRQEAEARAEARAAEARLRAQKQQLFQQIQQLLVEAEMHREEAELFRTAIIPQAEQSLSSAMAGYQVDSVDFLTLLNNQVTLYSYEIDYHRHLAEYEKTLAALEAAVGRRLF